jgi:hypothetical protein
MCEEGELGLSANCNHKKHFNNTLYRRCMLYFHICIISLLKVKLSFLIKIATYSITT